MTRSTRVWRGALPAALALTGLLAGAPAWAQTAPLPPDDLSDLAINVASPDVALVALPTTLRLPAGRFAFRMTHRFARPIAGTCPDEGPRPDGCGGVGAFIENFFGFDSAARVGIELRYGIVPGTQLALHRTNDRAMQLLAQTQLVRQTAGLGDAAAGPLVSVDAIAAVEGRNNFREDHGLTVGAVVSHQVRDRGAVFIQPLLAFNSNPASDNETDDNHTVWLGFGGRWRIGAKMYLVAEAAPRLAGYKPGVDHLSFAFEHRSGGHVFQINVSNALGTTLRQVATGGPGRGDWFIGFNLSRRFY